ncbi:MAG: N-acetylmuramic acid 6-phosphate etherase [Phycisphaerales bacterium]|nr:N-acetylmuramic acid 6-phosphate etherase [Phycisphaerales bacterium]
MSAHANNPTPPDRGHLLTEQPNERSTNLDAMSTRACLELINDEDATIARSVRDQIEHIATFTDGVIESLRSGGRLVYLGAGTSGRLGVLDASECPPTFQSAPEQVIGIIAGGDRALRVSSEHREDEWDGAHEQFDGLNIGANDSVFGIAAGGTTPFVLGGVEHAKSRGARTGLLTCTPVERAPWCDVLIAVRTGPEVLTGSTRMKAGTATKMVLNMISTGAMVGLGKCYSNMMVDVRATNDKLRDRAARIIMRTCGIERDASFDLLDRAANSVKHAIVMHHQACSREVADRLIRDASGHLSRVIGEHA